MDRSRTLGRTGLSVTPIAFGGYRVDDQTPGQRAALELALERGVNLIDTSTNYTDGGSERLIGEVLAARGADAVVVSKVGYVQGQNLAIAAEREAAGQPFPDMVPYAEGCWHCLSAEWIADQLTRSLARLSRPKVDVYLLHNPEYFFSDAKKRRDPRPIDELREVFYGRVRGAFTELERQRAAGRVGWYGVSSNTFGAPAGDPEAVSLARLREVGGDGFAVVQLPMNLFESRPALEKSERGGARTVLEEASDGGFGVLVNRPLNALWRGDLVRLADPTPRGARVSIADGIAFVEALEAEWKDGAGGIVMGSADGRSPIDQMAKLFRFGPQLAHAHSTGAIQGLMHWREIEDHNIWPRVNHLLAGVERTLGGKWSEWAARYRTGLGALVDALHDEQVVRAREAYVPLKKVLLEVVPEAWAEAPLSQLALRTIIDTPGVTSALVGMRRSSYVDDAIAAANAPPGVGDAAAIYRAMKRVG